MDYKFDLSNAVPWIFTGAAGLLGRVMFHAAQVQRGIRKPFSWVLLWDIPVAVAMGWIALGIATWTGLGWESTVSVSLVMAYLGPYGIDTIFNKWASWKFGGTKDGT